MSAKKSPPANPREGGIYVIPARGGKAKLIDGSRTAPPQSAPTAPSNGDKPDGSATTDQTERESS